MGTFEWRRPGPLAMWLAPLVPVMIGPSAAGAQVVYREPSRDPYLAGPTRPFDGSARAGRTTREVRQAPLPRPAIWGGTYLGLQAGYRWDTSRVDSFGIPAVTAAGLQAGAHLGRNFQFGPAVLGIETDVMAGGAAASKTAGGVSLAAQTTWTSTLRARAGYAFGDAMIYATAGIAVTGQDLTLSASGQSSHLSEARFGAVYGAGIEYQFAPSVSGRLEGLHFNTQPSTLAWTSGAPTVKQDSTAVRAGLTYHFN